MGISQWVEKIPGVLEKVPVWLWRGLKKSPQWLRTHVLPITPASAPATDSDMSKATTYVGTGFSILIAVLAFFGVKEGLLDRVLQAQPTESLYIFCLVGLGFLSGGVAAALDKRSTVYAIWVVVAVGMLGYFTLAILANFKVEAASEDVKVAVDVLVVVGVVLALVCVLTGATMPIIAAVLCVGVAATSMGLYGAAKISVTSKGPDAQPRVSVEVHDGDAPKVTLAVKAARREDNKLQLKLVGKRAGVSDVAIGSTVLTPDALGAIDETVTFPATATGWTELVVTQCEDMRKDPCSEVARLTLGSWAAQPQVSGAIERTEVAGVLSQTLHAYALPAEEQLEVSSFRERSGEEPIMVKHAIVEPADDGTVAWTSSLVGCQAGDKFKLHFRLCPKGKCGGEPTPVASYLVP